MANMVHEKIVGLEASLNPCHSSMLLINTTIFLLVKTLSGREADL